MALLLTSVIGPQAEGLSSVEWASPYCYLECSRRSCVLVAKLVSSRNMLKGPREAEAACGARAVFPGSGDDAGSLSHPGCSPSWVPVASGLLCPQPTCMRQPHGPVDLGKVELSGQVIGCFSV